ncbi:MAG: TIM barrel protein [Actinobacteria bacterium]|nr:TIM barrel protein [Actinomycetota bacterium]
MELRIYRPLWGVTEPLAAALEQARADGFDGIEDELPPPGCEQELKQLLAEHGLGYIPLVLAEGETPREQTQSLELQLSRAAEFTPPVIVCHAGRDRWPLRDTVEFLERILSLEQRTDVAVAHETHRNRALFSPWRTSELLEALPELRLCCDFSHWVLVAERLLEEEQEQAIRDRSAERCLHVHARVGFENGPQVADPRAPECARLVEVYGRWWEEIWAAQERRGLAVSTLSPEYGPPSYLQTLPFTGTPVADLAEVILWQAQSVRNRFERRRRVSKSSAGGRAASPSHPDFR